MLHAAKKAAVQTVKPRVSERTWAWLHGPGAVEPKRKPASAPKPAPSLTDLATKFGTDKWGMHWYTQHYERHLAHLRGERFTLLEIGIGGYARDGKGGASLRMWKSFFPKAQIVGLDIEDKSFVERPRIRTYRGSQVDPEILDRIVADAGDLRVIIDDGSHRPEHIRETFAYLFPQLADGGVYAIEDTQTSYWPTWGGSETLDDPATSMSMVKDLVDGVNFEEFPDPSYEPTYVDRNVRAVHAYHNLVILDKASNVEGSNRDRTRRTLDESHPDHRPAAPVAEQRRPYTPVPPQR